MKLDQATKKLLKQNLGLKKGEKIAVVTDRKNCSLFKSLCKSAEELKSKVIKVNIKKIHRNRLTLP